MVTRNKKIAILLASEKDTSELNLYQKTLVILAEMSETEKRNMSLATDITTTTNDEDDGLFVDIDSFQNPPKTGQTKFF